MERSKPLQDCNSGHIDSEILLNTTSSESSPLLKRKFSSHLVWRYSTTRKFISSKSALLTLLWSFVLGLWNGIALNPDLYLRNFVISFALSGYFLVAFIFCFFPLAGFLADIKYGRYKIVKWSLFLLVVSIPLACLLGGLIGTFIYLAEYEKDYRLVYLVMMVIVSVLGLVVLGISYIGLVGFSANVIQFGMDQLHDSPGEDRTLFIHWYVWGYYTTSCIGQLAWNLAIQFPYNFMSNLRPYNIVGCCLLGLIPLFITVVLAITLRLAERNREWFLIEPGRLNPYKLVYLVTKFAQKHKIPVRRSAFTYCEDKVPTGLDLAKEKYGGSFTTEQVEDVKVFYGILKVLFSFGAVFSLDFAATSVLPMYALHFTPYEYNSPQDSHLEFSYNGTLLSHIVINSGLLSPFLIAISMPFYLCALRPFMSAYIPGMLKRMGLGMVLVLCSLIISFSMDMSVHMTKDDSIGGVNSTRCNMFPIIPEPYGETHSLHSTYYLITQLTLSALSHMLIYTAVFEFVCSQSPHSMKGLLIGLLYAIKGLYQLFSAILLAPYLGLEYSNQSPKPSCGVYYYGMNIVIGAVAVLVYMWVAKRYRYRERDEPSNIHRYAEEYYSKTEQEEYYD